MTPRSRRWFIAALPLVLLAACASPQPASSCDQSGAALDIDARVCAAGGTLKGVDVSTYDGKVDWATVKGGGITFAFARISDGTTHPDDQFAANWPGMKAAGVIRGAYQYFRAGEDPTAQANLVASALTNAGGLVSGDLPVVADVETADGQSAATIEAHLKTWLDAVEHLTGRTPIIYTSSGTWPLTSSTFSSYVLWVANYGASCPSMPAGFAQWAFWQTTSTGTTPGISIKGDLDEFNGSLADLLKLTGGAGDGGAPPADGGSSSGGSSSGGSSSGGSSSGGSSSGGSSGGGSSGGGSSGGGSSGGPGTKDAGAAPGRGPCL